ncbi:hypothetical protein [Nonomuraea angiospora]
MSCIEIILGIILGLVINEMCDVSPWLARRLIRWSARHQYVDPERAELRAEELTALINGRPGKLFKLCTGLTFAAAAICVRLRRLGLFSQYFDQHGGIRFAARYLRVLYLVWFRKRSFCMIRGQLGARFIECREGDQQAQELARTLYIAATGMVFTKAITRSH